MKIKKYRPNFFEGFEDEVYEVNSKEDLLNCPLCSYEKIVRVYVEMASQTQLLIMHELSNGERWIAAIVHDKEDIKTLQEWFEKIE